MNGSTPVKVGESLEKIPRQAKVKKSAYQPDGAFPVIDQGKDYIAGYTDNPELRYAGPLPLTIFGDHTRILKWVDSPFAVGADGTQLLRGDERFDQRYFYYALCTLELEHFGYERHFKYLKEEEIPCPDLPTQRRIAGILSAYDDLIENNLRRIRILEEMAQSLYREWFVHFRFPRDPSEASAKAGGHESVPLVDSPLGPIPEGWEASEIGSLTTKVGSGATPRGGKESYKTEGVPLVRSMNIYDYNFEFGDLAFIDSQQAEQLANVSLEAGDVLLNITGASVCRCAMIPSYLVPARVNQHVAIIRANPDLMDAHFLLDSINSDENKRRLFNLAQGGATREALTKDAICRFEIVIPPLELVRRYGRVAGPLHSQRETLQRRNQNLRQTRDLLLPKLLMGND